MQSSLRVLHTSDWHLGKMIGPHRRWDEQEAFIEELVAIAGEEDVQLVLVAGDIFDTENPPARAEELYFEALSRLAVNGRRVVVIAGNHDQPERLAASSSLASRQGVHILGRPKETPSPGPGVLEKGPSRLVVQAPGWPFPAAVLALPYPSEARLQEFLSDSLEETDRQEAYSLRVKQVFSRLARICSPGRVNLAVSHLYVRGGRTSDSERHLSLGGAYGVDAGIFPPALQYVALGHLHRPQGVKGTSMPCRYSGSPLAYSFSEAGQSKSVVIAEVVPGRPARWREIPLSSGCPLVRWQASSYQEALYWCEAGRDRRAWIDLEIRVPAPLTREEVERLRRERPRIIDVRTVLPRQEGEGREILDYATLPLDELFTCFYRNCTRGGEPKQELVDLFLELVSSPAGKEGEPDETH